MPRFTRDLSSGFVVWAVVLGLWTGSAGAQGLEYVKAHYTKYEYRIPMRDGKRLFTAVYVPKDQSQRYPILLDADAVQRAARTAWTSTRATSGPSPLFGKAGYIFVYQDVRGRWMSEGEFVNVRPHQPVKNGPGRRRREQRHLGHDRLAAQARAQPQRQGGHVGHLLSRLLRGRRA